MQVFPKQTLVNTPFETMLEGKCSVSVRISTPDHVPATLDFYGRRLYNVEIEDGSIRDIDLIRAIGPNRIRLILGDINVLEVDGRLIETLQEIRAKPAFEILPDGNLFKNINFLTGLGMLVHIDMSKPVQDEKALLRVTDFYLHNPTLSTPIEPIHSLLVLMNRGRGNRLWSTEQERVRTNFYVSNQGEVSLSRRWMERSLKYGSLDDSVDEFMKSGLYSKLASLKAELFRNKSPCIFCRHFDVCNGFLRALDPEWPCDIWQEVFGILKSAVKEGRNLLRIIDKQRDRLKAPN
jgi:radical SAM protein with 4Fe4S-binding SPASM domain